MKNTQANTQIENANVIATELRNATSNAYFGYLNFNETDVENLIKVSQVDNKTIIHPHRSIRVGYSFHSPTKKNRRPH